MKTSQPCQFIGFAALLCCGCLLGGRLAQAQPIITNQPVGLVGNLGSEAVLSAGVAGDGLGYQWLKDGVILTDQTSSSMTIGSIQITNCGNYRLVATNLSGTAISLPAALSVPGVPLQAWGYNGSGQLGLGSSDGNPHPDPHEVAKNVVAAAAGGYHSLFVKSDRTLWAVGNNSFGQLGNGTNLSTNNPIYVASNVVAAAAGGDHSLFIKSDGSLWAMGNNSHGQLGNGTTTDTNHPVSIASNVVAVAAGVKHTLFVTSDGKLWSMGWNIFGQLGNAAVDPGPHPTPMIVASNVVAVAAGTYHSLYVRSDRTLWAMGRNSEGQLGSGTTINTNLPILVASNVVAAAAGAYHSLFIKTDGTLWTVGYNRDGQLGNGMTADTNLPVNVASDVVAATGGAFHSLFIKGDGRLRTMGLNHYGQLGNGGTNKQSLPVELPDLTVASLSSMDQAFHSLVVAVLAPRVSPLLDQSIVLGQQVTFTLTVTNGTGPFTYQWQFNGTNITDAMNDSYTIDATKPADAGSYTGIVHGIGGTASSSAMLTITIPAPNLTVTLTNVAGANLFRLHSLGFPDSNYVLNVATNLTLPVDWQPVFTNSADSNGVWQFDEPELGDRQRFYRLSLP